jgi:hypothetical protein
MLCYKETSPALHQICETEDRGERPGGRPPPAECSLTPASCKFKDRRPMKMRDIVSGTQPAEHSTDEWAGFGKPDNFFGAWEVATVGC